MSKEYEFPYIGHGKSHSRKNLECYVWFNNILNEKEREWVQETAPQPISCFFNWNDDILHLGSDDALEEFADSDDAYEPNEEEWEAFYQELEDWIKKVNKKYGVAFFIKPSSKYNTELSNWHKWSLSKI